MNLSRYWIRVLAFLLLLSPSLIHAQTNSISLDVAVELFQEHSLQRTLIELEQNRQLGEARHYKAFQNPEVSVYQERLNAGSPNYDETTIQLSQPLEIFGQPFLRNKSTSALNEAAQFEFQYREYLLIGQLKSLYTHYWFLSNKLKVITEALSVVSDTRQSAIARKEEGTYSGIEIQRFSIEYSKYQKYRDEILSDLNQTKNQLLLMISPEMKGTNQVEFTEEFVVRRIVLPRLVNGS